MVLPPAAARADYQLGGGYALPAGVRIVSRDRSDRPVPGAYSICYLNAFQTQPQDTGWWRRNHRELLLHDGSGGEVGDPDWPGEVLLDTRTPAKRTELAAIVGDWIDGCARSGFAAVEPDNLDSWTRSHGLLNRDGNIAYARLLTTRSHSRRLAIAQKNTAELASQARRIGLTSPSLNSASSTASATPTPPSTDRGSSRSSTPIRAAARSTPPAGCVINEPRSSTGTVT